jgi:hypothetical protein
VFIRGHFVRHAHAWTAEKLVIGVVFRSSLHHTGTPRTNTWYIPHLIYTYSDVICILMLFNWDHAYSCYSTGILIVSRSVNNRHDFLVAPNITDNMQMI